jgi:hypothetical protein
MVGSSVPQMNLPTPPKKMSASTNGKRKRVVEPIKTGEPKRAKEQLVEGSNQEETASPEQFNEEGRSRNNDQLLTPMGKQLVKLFIQQSIDKPQPLNDEGRLGNSDQIVASIKDKQLAKGSIQQRTARNEMFGQHCKKTQQRVGNLQQQQKASSCLPLSTITPCTAPKRRRSTSSDSHVIRIRTTKSSRLLDGSSNYDFDESSIGSFTCI